jgi:hypothetical protein
MYCPRCEQTTEPGVMFCQHCGFRLRPAGQSAPQPAQGNAAPAAK